MTLDTYASIGPFKGVPADFLAECARRSNAAHEASIVAVTRHATFLGDIPDRNAVIRSSVSVLNAAWKAVEADTSSSLKSAKADFSAALCIPVFLWIPLVSVLYWILRDAPDGPFPLLLIITFLCAGSAAFSWVASGRGGLAAMREIRRQGFFADTLPLALEALAGQCLLVGTKGLHYASRDANGKVSVKTIYWDAIGHASSEVDENGLEVVDIHGRDGSALASISGPSGFRDASGLVSLISQEAEAVRKAA